MRRLILIFTLFIAFTINAVIASDNYLNAVVLEGIDNSYNIILRSDLPAKVKKTVKSEDKLVLTLKGVTVSDNVNTLYKNISNANNIIVENSSNGEVKVYINAKGAANANVILNTPNSAPIPVGDKFAREKIIWSVCSIAFLLLMIHSIKSKNRRIVRRMNMRDREIEFYKAAIPSINYKLQGNYAAAPLRTDAKTLRQLMKSF